MNKKLIIISSIIAMIGLTSCGSNPTKKHGNTPNEVFVTHINSNNSKIFNYSLINKTPNQGQRGKGRGKQGGMGRGMKSDKNPDFSKMKGKAYKKLNIKLIETGYCREGYMELDDFFERGQVTIKGECNDRATQEDRDIFINLDS